MRAPSVSLLRLRKDDDDPYRHLANAIICVAADDYRTALAKNDTLLLLNLQSFFRSAWCGALTGINTELLMDAIQKEHDGRLRFVNMKRR